jgi:hypothetical protein
MRRKILYVTAAVIVVAVVAIVWQRIRASEDEAPIIVKNGSIEIETLDGEWKDGNDAWINQTSGKINSDDLWVKVTSSTGTCRAVGKPVQVQYSQPNVRAVFTTSGFWWTTKTRVSPQAGLSFVDRKHLRAGTAGDGGHITEVRAQNLTCSIAAGSANVEISICSSSKTTACQ